MRPSYDGRTGAVEIDTSHPLRVRLKHGPIGLNRDDMLPGVEDLPSVESVDEALERLARDRDVCIEVLSGIDEDRLLTERSRPPWGGPEVTLFQHCLSMIWHLGQHKGQLFYYLKLQGQEVATWDLWAGGS